MTASWLAMQLMKSIWFWSTIFRLAIPNAKRPWLLDDDGDAYLGGGSGKLWGLRRHSSCSFSGSVAGVVVVGCGLGLAASITCKATTNCCWIGHTEGNGKRAKVQSWHVIVMRRDNGDETWQCDDMTIKYQPSAQMNWKMRARSKGELGKLEWGGRVSERSAPAPPLQLRNTFYVGIS